MKTNNDLINYSEEHTSGENSLLIELREFCYANFANSNMLSGFYQGRILSMVSNMLKPKLIVEVGTYVGYSALCLAEGLDSGGRLITFDMNAETNVTARSYIERSEFSHQIECHLKDAALGIPEIDESIDLAFIDADKENYSKYYDLVFNKLRIGGIIIADNVLWSGKVLDKEKDEPTKALYNFNEKVFTDERVSNVLLPVRDGLMIIRKDSE